MYLSKLVLNSRSAEARRDLARPYELHRTLARAFSTAEGQDYRATHQVLFRVESGPGLPVVLVQSGTLPDWSQLTPGYLDEHKPFQCREFTPQFTPGQVMGFRLVANPTKKVSREGRRQGNRVPLFDAGGDELGTPAHQWLQGKATQSGFSLLHLFSDGFNLLASRRSSGGHGKADLPLYGVRFDGMLQVTDPELLTVALQQGIGPAKAFGFGLLSLANPAH